MAAKQTATAKPLPSTLGGGSRNVTSIVFDVVSACTMKDSNGKHYDLSPRSEFKVWLWGESTYRAETDNVPTVIDRKDLVDLETAGLIAPRNAKDTLISKSPTPPVASTSAPSA